MIKQPTFLGDQFTPGLAFLALVASYDLIACHQLQRLLLYRRLTCLLRFFGRSCLKE